MGAEEQQEEREVLESIFADEITGEPFPFMILRSRSMHRFFRRLSAAIFTFVIPELCLGIMQENAHKCADISSTEFRISITLDIQNTNDDEDNEDPSMMADSLHSLSLSDIRISCVAGSHHSVEGRVSTKLSRRSSKA